MKNLKEKKWENHWSIDGRELRSISMKLPLCGRKILSGGCRDLHHDWRYLLGRGSLPSGYNWELLLSARDVLWGRLSFDARGMLHLGFSLYRPRVVAPTILFWSMLGDQPQVVPADGRPVLWRPTSKLIFYFFSLSKLKYPGILIPQKWKFNRIFLNYIVK
jgi:hypothetical protein